MFMFLEMGNTFDPPDITIHVLKDTRLTVKGCKEDRKSDRVNKQKFSKEFVLDEKIDPSSVRGGITVSGRLLIGALGKSHVAECKKAAAESLWQEINANSTPVAVLDLHSFPPQNAKQA